jgi:hypothetical protein
VTNVSARHCEREVGVLITTGPVTRRQLRTQLGSADQSERPLGDVLPVPERRAAPLLGQAAMDACQGVQTELVDELKSGEIDDQTRRAGCSRLEFAVERRFGCSVKPPAEPHDLRLSAALPTNHQLPRRDGSASVADHGLDTCQAPEGRLASHERERCSHKPKRPVGSRDGLTGCAAVWLYARVGEVHAAPAVGSVSETVTGGRGDSTQLASPGVWGNAISSA